ncbi:hypothetical protein [Cohnella soli]|uniref:DUF4320 family protein n=1 Tax=Cohnella soli TaxID=425005 RepID=A0ABW0HQD1_9BACL
MIWNKLLRPLKNQKGVTNLITLLIVLVPTLGITVIMLTIFLFLMKQAKMDDMKDRALQMVQTAGYLTPQIQTDLQDKLSSLGYPTVVKGGVTYPSFAGTTTTLVRKYDADPTIRLVIKYPATDLAKVMFFFGISSTEEPGYFYLDDYGRSEHK